MPCRDKFLERQRRENFKMCENQYKWVTLSVLSSQIQLGKEGSFKFWMAKGVEQ